MNGEIKAINGIYPITVYSAIKRDNTNQTLLDELDALTTGSSNDSKYKNKNFIWLGDSISSGSGSYPTLLANKLGATINNLASSGANSNRLRKIALGLDPYSTPDYSNINYVCIMIGHNCAGIESGNQTIAILDETYNSYTDYPTDNFYGDVACVIEFIQEQNSNIEIILITPPKSTNGTYSISTPLATAALKKIGERYSCPVIDIHNISGINKKNINVFTLDGTHLNDSGKEKVAEKIYRQLLSF